MADDGTTISAAPAGGAALACRLCGGATRHWVWARDRVTGGRARIVRCDACGVGATDGSPRDVPAARSWVPGNRIARAAGEWLIRAELRQLRPILGPPGSRVLDVGAGSGARAGVLAGRGYRVTALEPDPAEAAAARARLTGVARVVVAPLEAIPADVAGLDAALMSHVLEHVEDPAEALRLIHARLRPGAHLVVLVPNPRGLEARAFAGRWHGWEPARHRWHFTAAGLTRLLAGAGYADVAVRAAGGWRYPASLAFSLAPTLDPQTAPGAKGVAGHVLTVALAPVALAQAAIGRGPQLRAVGRRCDR